MSLGRHIRIERSLSSLHHYCRIALSGELLQVAIDPEHRECFVAGRRDSSWCPFLREGIEGIFTCTIHGNRPRICRDFRCRTMLIFDRSGAEAGHVKGARSLVTADPVLESLWQEARVLRDPDSIRELLRGHGYRAELLE